LETILKTDFDPAEEHPVRRRIADFAGFPPTGDQTPERVPGAFVAAIRALVGWTRLPVPRISRRDANLG
jgi:hypothetical protein